ncbi:exodeoxyribonuclease VII large subunit [Ethanoligenens sp.]|uniref:exodeoxyribonuclease VII large subunit n=1 Tax=Ethanoligenens sp. TaxID=2099655 RepID=UPI0039EB8E47
MKTGFSVLTVSQLNFYVHTLLESDERLSGVFLRGEISNFKNHFRSGHFYLSIKDENAVIRAVMFKGNAQRLRFLPQDGMKVIVSGRVSLYERDGQYQFYIDDMQPDGVGALHVAYEQLKEKLLREGLFDPARKHPLPLYPERVGVVTSETGAALQDILHVLERRWPLAEVVLAPVLVQGPEAPAQICNAIRAMNAAHAANVLIVGRGGGSIEDLWAFNDEDVARCIVDSEIPVVSAVGHETDFTIADFAADVRAPTPSAAAELLSPDQTAVMAEVFSLRAQMSALLVQKVTDLRGRQEKAAKALQRPAQLLDMYRMKADMLDARLAAVTKIQAERGRASFAALAARLDALSPLKVLSRGYTVVEDTAGRVVTRTAALSEDEMLLLRFADGQAHCMVKDVEHMEIGAVR